MSCGVNAALFFRVFFVWSALCCFVAYFLRAVKRTRKFEIKNNALFNN